jgi:transcriptional regulator with XRE-family HTH domain
MAINSNDIRKLKAGAPCTVKRKLAGRGYVWVPGNIKEHSGKGAFVVDKDGNTQFYRWTEVRFPPPTPKEEKPERPVRAVAPLATLGDVLKPALADRPYLDIPNPAPAPAPAPPVVSLVVNDKDELKLPARQRRKGYRRVAKVHSVSYIGAMLRAARIGKAMSQKRVASELGVSYGRMSDIELGDVEPTLQELELCAMLFDVALEKLVRANAKSFHDEQGEDEQDETEPEPETEEPLFVQAPPKPDFSLLPPIDQLVPPAPLGITAPPATWEPPLGAPIARPVDPSEFPAFVDQLDALVPMPRDRAQRADWFVAAQALFKLRGV